MFKLKTHQIIFLLFYSLTNTLLSFATVYIINNVMAGNPLFLKDYTYLVFFLAVVFSYFLNIFFQKRLIKYTFETLCKNEKKIFNKIVEMPLVTIEKIGTQRIYAAIEDMRLFYGLPGIVTAALDSVLTLIMAIVYLFLISGYSALIVIGLIILVAGLYFVVINLLSDKVAKVRKLHEDYFGYVDDVIKGFKELKINVTRRYNLLNNHLYKNRDSAAKLDSKLSFVFQSIGLMGQYGFLLIMGVILFLLPKLDLLSREDLISYVVLLLFISGPINNLVKLQDISTRFIVSYGRLKAFFEDIKSDEKDSFVKLETPKEFESLNFKGIYFEFKKDEVENNFSLGPLDLTINKGETIFIVGGNGSGKSTLMSILTGLYTPLKGEIMLNGNVIQSPQEVQNLSAAVFTDNYILSKNYDDYPLEGNTDYKELLNTMELDNVILDDNEVSARRNFSKGQSKRMSLILALLENKPILFLDEWAADQDPHFRKYFYEILLPKWKEQGKTVIAITHDDAYFKHADRIIKLDYGQIVKEISVADNVEGLESFWH